MRRFTADLHIHTCLSPCGELTMSPARIVEEAVDKGINIIAICDHNSADNAGAVMEVAQGRDIAVLPGMEVTTREEVHICGLFGDVKEALGLQELVYKNLEGSNDPDAFGMQVIVNAAGEVLGMNERLLIGATGLALEEVVNAIHKLSGLAIAAHIDRQGFGIIGQLGFIPAGLPLDALEVSPRMGISGAREHFPEYAHYPLICSSDAHQPGDIGSGTTDLLMEAASFEELRLALRGEAGRRIIR